jgi:hypothetical protein
MVRKLKNFKREKCTLYDWEYVEKLEKLQMGEMHTVGPVLWREN